MQERTEDFIRLALASRVMPRPAATLATDVLARVAAVERERHPGSRRTTRVLLVVCWLAVASGSAWILWSIRWPAWTPSAVTLSDWLVPIACGVLSWRAAFIKWLAACCARLLQEHPQRGDRP